MGVEWDHQQSLHQAPKPHLLVPAVRVANQPEQGVRLHHHRTHQSFRCNPTTRSTPGMGDGRHDGSRVVPEWPRLPSLSVLGHGMLKWGEEFPTLRFTSVAPVVVDTRSDLDSVSRLGPGDTDGPVSIGVGSFELFRLEVCSTG